MPEASQHIYSADRYDRAGAERLLGLLAQGALLCQGPMGTVLMGELGAADIPAAAWNLAEPQEVTRIHQLYAAAGAQVLISNTFQASTPALERDCVEGGAELICAEAVACAQAAGARNVLGSVGPCGVEWFEEDSAEYREARDAYREQVHALLDAGVQACMLETFTSIRDLEPALAGALDVADGMPLFVSFAVDDDGNLLGDGLNIEAACVWAEKHGAQGVGVNCCSLAAATACVSRMVAVSRGIVSARPSAGLPERDEDGILTWTIDADAFASASVEWAAQGARLIGTCCGTTPATLCAMADALDAAGQLTDA